MNLPLIEGCVDSYASAVTACRSGTDRLELCANLSIGGTTPSPLLFQQVRRDCPVKINVLIRPRFGDFLYTDRELDQMCGEIEMFRSMGADGVVAGVLTPEGELDMDCMARLIRCAGGLPVTLHRAFDMTRDPVQALEAAIALGCHTVLTSGQAQDVWTGREVLKAAVEQAAGRITVMAGGGVKPGNIRALYDYAGVAAFHTSGRRGPVDSGMVYRRQNVSMGLPSLSEYELWRTDPEEFRLCAEQVHALA